MNSFLGLGGCLAPLVWYILGKREREIYKYSALIIKITIRRKMRLRIGRVDKVSWLGSLLSFAGYCTLWDELDIYKVTWFFVRFGRSQSSLKILFLIQTKVIPIEVRILWDNKKESRMIGILYQEYLSFLFPSSNEKLRKKVD